MLIEKANEWDIPLYIMDADLPKAYDNTKHDVTAARLDKRGFPKFYTASIIRETRRSKVKVSMGAIVTDPIMRGKSLCQGGADAPRIFNHVFDEDILDFVVYCKSKRWGFPISHDKDGMVTEFVPILAFCDNFWLLAKSPSELQNMSNIFFSRCKAAGWEIPLAECVWTTTARDDDERWVMKVEGQTIDRRSRDDGVKILGCIVSAGGRLELEFQNRFSAAWSAFYRHVDMFCCQKAPLLKRLQLLRTIIEPTLFWCAGTWHMN